MNTFVNMQNYVLYIRVHSIYVPSQYICNREWIYSRYSTFENKDQNKDITESTVLSAYSAVVLPNNIHHISYMVCLTITQTVTGEAIHCDTGAL
jgi:hypothetical protein